MSSHILHVLIEICEHLNQHMQKYDWFIKIYGKCAIACGSICNQNKIDEETASVRLQIKSNDLIGPSLSLPLNNN